MKARSRTPESSSNPSYRHLAISWFRCQLPSLIQVRNEFPFRSIVASFKQLVNRLISLFEEEMYDRKKRLVETLRKLAE